MAACAGVPQLTPLVRTSLPHVLANVVPVTAPVRDDASSETGAKVTAVFRQFADAGHYPVFDDPSARGQWRVFFEQLLRGSGAVVPAP